MVLGAALVLYPNAEGLTYWVSFKVKDYFMATMNDLENLILAGESAWDKKDQRLAAALVQNDCWNMLYIPE